MTNPPIKPRLVRNSSAFRCASRILNLLNPRDTEVGILEMKNYPIDDVADLIVEHFQLPDASKPDQSLKLPVETWP